MASSSHTARNFVATVLVLLSSTANAQDCTTLSGLLPGPLDGWELFNGAPDGVEGTLAKGRYSLILERNEDGSYVDSSLAEVVSVRIESDPTFVEQNASLLRRGPMPGMLIAGPLDYPTMAGTYSTVIGDFHVSIDGNGAGTDLYFETIIGCGLAAGLAPVADYTQ